MTDSVSAIDQTKELSEQRPAFDLNRLPDSFRSFLKDNSIDPAIYTVTRLPRYFRINTQIPVDKKPTLEDLKKQLNTEEVNKVEGIDDFYSAQLGDVRLSDTPAYKEHIIFGIDLSSAIAVEALCIEKDDQILDLCCAPGAKLCMISNLFDKDGVGTVTGVDIAAHRLATCRSLLKKYRAGERVRLFEADGTKFSIPPPSRLGSKVISTDNSQKRPKKEIVKPFWAPKTLRSDRQLDQGILYDKVLVDAECTHDGSILHILKVFEK
ncbi:S-adenosyl-L-methionine-dependent methyltransferase [Sporodiniella umbellata]|nr:S-adenosyl-L-methionine-dependent methyltransferase [Sporodiniella umbellata]